MSDFFKSLANNRSDSGGGQELLIEMAERESKHLESADRFQEKIEGVQRAGEADIPALALAHDELRLHHKWYYCWHMGRYTSLVHYIVLLLYLLLILWLFWHFGRG